jgi:DnaJ-class molecular chaperone
MFGYGFGWMPTCKMEGCHKSGDHSDGAGTYYCKKHYLITTQGHSECPGCQGTGQPMAHGQPARSMKGPCNLCKGEGLLAP